MMGEIVRFDSREMRGTYALRWVFKDDHIVRYFIPWALMTDLYVPLPSVLASFIGGVLCPNHRPKGFVVEWVHVLESMVM